MPPRRRGPVARGFAACAEQAAAFVNSYFEPNLENILSWLIFAALIWTVVERTRRHYQVEGETNFETGTLSLSGLGLKALTDDVFSGMNGLVVLRLNNNILQALPKMVFRDLINLRILHLGSNKIASLLPRAFSKLQSLQQLDIGGNLLAKIPVSAFKGLFNLQSLIISSNRLKTLPGEIFKELSRLEILDLQSNRLESLPYNVLTGLTSLRELYLQDNELPELPARMFSNLTRLQVLNLEQNQMKALQPSVYSSLVKMLANRYDLEETAENTWGTCLARESFAYTGPCWNDTNVVFRQQGRGYMMLVKEDQQNSTLSKLIDRPPMGLLEASKKDSPESSSGVAERNGIEEYNVTMLANVGVFCGIPALAACLPKQGIGASDSSWQFLGLGVPPHRDVADHPFLLDWWSLEGFFSLSLVVSWAPRVWIRYTLILLFVCISLYMHTPPPSDEPPA